MALVKSACTAAAVFEDVAVNGLFGAVFDIGGNAEEDTGAAVNGLFGAAFDMGGKVAFADEAFFSSFFGTAKLKPLDVGA